jgi:NAD(P)-dependent dehydrogenase (short-subunit alcohol dehydrogenase family)
MSSKPSHTSNNLSQTYHGKHIIIVGASGAIGKACANRLQELGASLTLLSRSDNISQPGLKVASTTQSFTADITNETTLQTIAESLAASGKAVDGILVTTGILHDHQIQPEKSIRQLSSNDFMRIIEINTLGPALVARYFSPLLAKQTPVWFAALSARVGSICDNRLGGWYAYRASKSALNMVIKNLSIELSRRHKSSVVVGLHPGTVDSELSKPFQTGVTPSKLFTPSDTAERLLGVLANLSPADSGRCFDWAGKEVPP